MRWKTDPSRGGGRGTRVAGRDGRDGPRDCAGVGPWRPAANGDDRPSGTTACSRHARGRTPCRWRRVDCSVGRSSGEAAGPRRRSARGELRLDSERQPWHNNGDRLGLSELGAVTRVRPSPGPSPTSESVFNATRTRCPSPARKPRRYPCAQARAPTTIRPAVTGRLTVPRVVTSSPFRCRSRARLPHSANVRGRTFAPLGLLLFETGSEPTRVHFDADLSDR